MQFPVGTAFLFLQLVLHAGVSLRGAASVLALLGLHLGFRLRVPDWTTGRGWLLSLGYYKLTRPKEQADDWIWLIDHSCQLGAEKCLLVLGARLSALPTPGQSLRLADLEPLEVLPVRSSTKQDVADQLQQLTAKTGAPRAILRDDGGDLRGGVELFCREHPETLDLYDIKHKTACLLRHTLNADPRWEEYGRHVATTKRQVQQTELAFLAPPNQRAKARYMNIDEYVRWGEQTLRLLEEQPARVREHVTPERLETKLGWLREYQAALTEWSELMDVVHLAEDFVRRDGIYVAADEDLAEILPTSPPGTAAATVRDALLTHVKGQAAGARPGEYLPASTEVLESCFGKLKHLERDQSRSGFTHLLLSLGALVGETTAPLVQAAQETCPLKCVWRWCRDKMGTTLHSKRRKAYNSATETG